MTLKQHLQKNIVLALPVVIGQLGHIMVGVADSVMVGRLGVIPLAAATFAGTIYHILMLFGIGVSYAITPKVAATDIHDRSKLLGFLQNGFFMNLGLGLILFGLGYVCSHFLGYFGQEAPVAAAAGPYLIIMCGSLIPLMIFQTFRQYAEGLSDTFSPMIVSVFANLLNVFFNYMLIYGKLGAPALGLNGAGYATLMARIIMFSVMIWWVKGKIAGFEWKYNWKGIKELLRIGLPSGMQYVFEVGAFATAAIMVGWISAEALAAHNIALNLAAISYMAATGLAAASTIRIGNQMGLKDRRNLRIAGFSSFGMVTLFMAICGLTFILLRNVLPALYIEDSAVRTTAASLLVIAAAFQISDGIQAVGLGVLRGLTDVRIPTIVTFIAYWLIAIPIGYWFAFHGGYGVQGMWYGLSLGLTISGILHIWRFNRLSKKIKFV
ncbi:MATE family efflux transporter [Ekhidna sp.]|uniref:MATE family efflux transporter n=1 Tax=Ekhidna sp. TaxID=2608089 RepID=UPI003C7D660F